jgi:hypothetical protein
MKKEYIVLIVVGVLLILIGYFWLVLPFILTLALSYFVIKTFENKIVAIVVSWLGLTYIGSIFSLIIFYCEPSRVISQLDAAMSILTWATVTNYIDLLINIWMATEGPGLQWVIFGSGTAVIIFVIVTEIYRDRIAD